MEAENSVTLESCGEDSILIQTVKNMVTENTALTTEEERFFVVTDVQNEQETVTEAPNEELTITQCNERLPWSNLCRICANTSDHLIPIFEGEGLQHDLCSKIHKHLPIRISENDILPLQLCYHCAATLLAWHELLGGCLTAEKQLLEIHDALQEKQNSEVLEAPMQDITSASNATESLHQQQEAVKDEVNEESAVNNPDRWKTKSSGVARILKIKNESTNKEGIEYVQCVRCNTIFVNMQYFIDHMNTEHSVQIHYCQYCKLAYSQGKDFEEHMKTHGTSYEEPKDATKDDTVERSTDVEKDSLQDKKATNEETEKFSSFTCNLCGRTFRKKWVLENHIYRHTEINWGENTSETELVRKAQQKINNRLSYKCDTCKKIILTKRGFLRHIRVHFDKRPCTCDLCGKSYRIEQDLARHIRDVHDGLKKYACDICGRAFANKGAKDDHRRIHTGERPYACEHCPKMFRTLNSIYVHNRIHTDYKPHKCSYCEKCFRSRQRLTNHETTHTRIKAFVCEICGKSFSVKGEVVRHKATHNEEKPFDCKCGMKFGQKRYLKSHIKQHHKEASS